MSIKLHTTATYLITDGATTRATTPRSEEFRRTLALIERAVAAGVTLVQLREKEAHPRLLYELTAHAATITRLSATRLLVNDRADIARAAGADGVHLTTGSLAARIVRRAFGRDFTIGVSTHSLREAGAARAGGADFATFGPVFATPSKQRYGPPVGLAALAEAARALEPFPLFALGGITLGTLRDVVAAGAKGVAAIRLYSDPPPHHLTEIVRAVEQAMID